MSIFDDLNTLDPVTPPPAVVVKPPAVVVKPTSTAWRSLVAAFVSAALAFPSGQWFESRRHVPPTPAPAPTPAPRPQPKPDVFTGVVFGLLILPDPPTPEQAALRASKVVREAADADGKVVWRTNQINDAEVTRYAPIVAENGGAPVVLWLDQAGKLIRATRSPIEASVVADMKALRGR